MKSIHMQLRSYFGVALFLISAVLLADSYLYGQLTAVGTSSPSIEPESGFLSPEQYTNAFFGFTLPLPRDAILREQTLSMGRGTRDHLLLGFHSPNTDLVSFAATAKEISQASDKDARKSAAAAGSSKPKEVEIAGRRFWRSESRGTARDRPMITVVFSTAMDHYILQFEIISFNPQVTAELEGDIERISFFDPSKSKLRAGPDSEAYMPGASGFAASRIARLSSGSVSGNHYHNEDLNFSYEFPQDWVLMSKAVGDEFAQPGDPFLRGNSPTAQLQHEAASQCTKDLLFVRRFVDNPSTGEFNPMVLLLAADPACISRTRFPKGVEEHETIQQIASQTIDYFRTARQTPTGPARVRAFSNAGRLRIEISQSFTLTVPGQAAPMTMLSSMLIMEAGDYWVIWIFASGNEVELKALRNTKVFFDDPVAPAAGSQTRR